ncbi:uncharacterized protein LOC144992159 [Oryzias latipes]
MARWSVIIKIWRPPCVPRALAHGPGSFHGEELASTSDPAAFVRRCQRTWRRLRASLLRNQERFTAVANRRRNGAPEYKVGGKVWLSSLDIPLKGGSRKLHPRFLGLFTITKVVNPVAVRLDLPSTLKVHPVFHVSKLKPVRESSLQTTDLEPPPPRYIDGGPVYSINQLLGSRRRRRGIQYLVDWVGYGPEHRQWVPERHILDENVIARFHRDNPTQPCRPSSSRTLGEGL